MLTNAGEVSLCSFRMGDETFGFKTGEVHEVLGVQTVHPVPLAPGFVAGVIPYRGEILTVLSFRRLLGMEALEEPSNVVVLQDEHAGELFGLAVDAMGAVLNFHASDFDEMLEERREALLEGSYQRGEEKVIYLKPELFWPMRLMEPAGAE